MHRTKPFASGMPGSAWVRTVVRGAEREEPQGAMHANRASWESGTVISRPQAGEPGSHTLTDGHSYYTR